MMGAKARHDDVEGGGVKRKGIGWGAARCDVGQTSPRGFFRYDGEHCVRQIAGNDAANERRELEGHVAAAATYIERRSARTGANEADHVLEVGARSVYGARQVVAGLRAGTLAAEVIEVAPDSP
jgi:hypothetical protein